MQNKANLLNAKMDVSTAITMDYVNIRLRSRFKNKPNSNPIQSQLNPIKPLFTPYAPKTNPIKPNFLDIQANVTASVALELLEDGLSTELELPISKAIIIKGGFPDELAFAYIYSDYGKLGKNCSC